MDIIHGGALGFFPLMLAFLLFLVLLQLLLNIVVVYDILLDLRVVNSEVSLLVVDLFALFLQWVEVEFYFY